MATLERPGPTLPRPFGNYTLLKSFGRGGMGEVFLARLVGSKQSLVGAERLCIVKTVRADLLAEQEYVARFIDEARLAVTLAHAGVCHVFDAGRADDVLFLAMEHIAGVTLRDIIDACTIAGKTIPLEHGLWILLELLDALDYAHAHVHPESGLPLNVVHRDVSPQNVMVSFDGEVKLIDFGLASSLMKALQTGDDHVMGKIAYMSPEQVQGSKLDGRVDQYASAILAFELLSGERFYGDMSNARVTQLVASGGHRPEAMRALPSGVYAVLDRALAPSRESRFRTCGAMASALRAELAKLAPTMSRSELRAWVQTNLAAELKAHRVLLRSLPSLTAEAEDTKPQTRAPGDSSKSSSSQKVQILEAPKTQAMARPRNDTSEADGSADDAPSTDVNARPGSDELAPKTDEDLRAPDAFASDDAAAPSLELEERPPRVSSVPIAPRSTAPQGTASSAAPPRPWALPVALALAAIVVVVAIAVLTAR